MRACVRACGQVALCAARVEQNADTHGVGRLLQTAVDVPEGNCTLPHTPLYT